MSEKKVTSIVQEDHIVYKGMTVAQLEDAYDVNRPIPNFNTLLQGNRERAQAIKTQLNPIENISYGVEEIQKLDVYAPKNAANMPVIMSIHGGGWTMGSKNPWAISAEVLMSKGIISVSVDYGLAPRYQMGEIINHVRQAIAWVYKNISHYGGDAERLYVCGFSAGAHLASTALMPNWQKDFDLPEDVIKGLIAMSGIYDVCSLVYLPHVESQKALQMTMEEARHNSPFYHISQNPIPSIIAYGEKEPMLFSFEAHNYAQELQKKNYDVAMIEVSHANHFDMINELANEDGELFKSVMKMVA